MQKDERSFSYYLRPILFGTLIAAVISAVLLMLLSFLMTNVDIPLGAINPLMIAISAISIFIGAFFVTRKVRHKGLFIGLCIALLFFLIMLLVSAATQPMGIGVECLYRFLACVVAGVIGGVLGVNSKSKALPI